MDPFHTRCKDIKPNIPDAFDRSRKAQKYHSPDSAVSAWINDLPESPHTPSPARTPLRETKQPSLKYPNSSWTCSRRSRRSLRWMMEDDNTQNLTQRGRSHPWEGRARRGRGRSKNVSGEDIFYTTKSSPWNKAVVKRGQLALMTPAIRFVSHETAADRGGLPSAVQDLWTDHIFPTLYRSDFIPLGLKDRLTTICDTPRKSKAALKPGLFDPIDIFDGSDLDLIWMTLSDVNHMADQYRNSSSESHWIGTVVSPLLHLTRRLSLFQSAGDRKRPLLEVLDITTTEISPQSLCPYSENPSLFKELDKRVDFAIGLHLTPNERDLLERGQFAENSPSSISQTADFINLTPLFINIEVKRRHTDGDPMIQLAAWIAAEFNKRKVEGYSLEMPVFAIAIDGDLWELYIAYSESPLAANDYRLNFLGPFDMGNTKTYQGIFQILAVLCCLGRWGLGKYRQWVEKEILHKYRPVS